ncbi:MAG TPA: PA14 domain-containing protein [Verrucomicrobiae bacterium]|nr:PA14 domain-containing protein [Verrucomicrobiae bacterium]
MPSAWASNRPLALHPENPHYFQFRGKPAVLIGSGEHYGAVLNKEFDYPTYLKELRSERLNHTRLFSGTYWEVPGSFNITDNTLAPRPEYFLSPWARSSTPGEFAVGNKFDLTRWDDAYFERLKSFIRLAGRYGIVVELSFFCPLYDEALWQVSPMNASNNINGIGHCGRNEVFTLKHLDLLETQKAVVRKFVAELNGFDNLYYEVCNEPWMGGVTTEWQNEIIDTIVAAQASLPNKHLIGLNPQGLNIRNPHPAVSIFNYHHSDAAEPVSRNYELNKVIGDNETGFRGKANFTYRSEAWDCLLAGGALFSHLDYSFSTRHPAGTLCEYNSPGGGNAELRSQFRVLKEFMAGFDFVRMKPEPAVIAAMDPPGAVVVQVLAEKGKAYAIYARRRTEVDRVTVRWKGEATPPQSGKFSFYTVGHDGVRLWINDKALIENSGRQSQPTESQGEAELQAGVPAKIRLEYYETGSNSVAKLLWSGPGIEKAIIPAASLKADDGGKRGLLGEYFEDRRMKQLAMTRVDPVIDFEWSADGPFAPVVAQSPVHLTLNLEPGRYQVEWIEPVSGKRISRERITASKNAVTLTSPPLKEDVALKITRR